MRYERGQISCYINSWTVAASGQEQLGAFERCSVYRKLQYWCRHVHGSGPPFRISFTYTAFTFTPNAIRHDAKSEKRVVTQAQGSSGSWNRLSLANGSRRAEELARARARGRTGNEPDHRLAASSQPKKKKKLPTDHPSVFTHAHTYG